MYILFLYSYSNHRVSECFLTHSSVDSYLGWFCVVYGERFLTRTAVVLWHIDFIFFITYLLGLLNLVCLFFILLFWDRFWTHFVYQAGLPSARVCVSLDSSDWALPSFSVATSQSIVYKLYLIFLCFLKFRGSRSRICIINTAEYLLYFRCGI